MSLTMEERNITPSEAYPGDKTTTKAAEPELLKVEITGDRYTSKEFKKSGMDTYVAPGLDDCWHGG